MRLTWTDADASFGLAIAAITSQTANGARTHVKFGALPGVAMLIRCTTSPGRGRTAQATSGVDSARGLGERLKPSRCVTRVKWRRRTLLAVSWRFPLVLSKRRPPPRVNFWRGQLSGCELSDLSKRVHFPGPRDLHNEVLGAMRSCHAKHLRSRLTLEQEVV